jgi:hypothetical protein
MGAERDVRRALPRAGRVTERTPATRADHHRFVTREGWQRVASTHHEAFELRLVDGRVLRTRISRPPDRTTYGPSLWAHVLRDQLRVSGTEFWACARDGTPPDRRPERPTDAHGTAIPIEVAELLIGRVGLRREDLVGMSRTEAIERLNAHWLTGR